MRIADSHHSSSRTICWPAIIALAPSMSVLGYALEVGQTTLILAAGILCATLATTVAHPLLRIIPRHARRTLAAGLMAGMLIVFLEADGMGENQPEGWLASHSQAFTAKP